MLIQVKARLEAGKAGGRGEGSPKSSGGNTPDPAKPMFDSATILMFRLACFMSILLKLI